MARKALKAVIQKAYIQGISTRSVDDAKALGMESISKSQIFRNRCDRLTWTLAAAKPRST
jgi:transposase-like protein